VTVLHAVLSTYYHGDVRDDVLACAVQHDVQSHSAMVSCLSVTLLLY